MHATLPRSVNSNSLIQATLKEALEPQLPPTLVDIINDYADIDYTEALGNFEHNKYGYIAPSPHNNAIAKAMKLALTSAECDPKIKRYLFNDGRKCRNVLFDVLTEIHKEGLRINLDNTDLSGCNFSDLDLSNMTAKSSSFVKCNLQRSILKGADLTGSVFFSCMAQQADFRHALLRNTTWTRVWMLRTNLVKADMTDAMMKGLCFVGTWVGGLVTNDTILKNVIRDADESHPFSKLIDGSSIVGMYSTGTGLSLQVRLTSYLSGLEKDFGF